MKRYLVVMERTKTGYSAYSPDLDGCVATGPSEAVVKQRMQEAVQLHLDTLRKKGYPIPDPSTSSSYIEVAA